MIDQEATWRVCPTCPPDDNHWPPEEFFDGMARCKACYAAQKKLALELKEIADTPEERARIRKKRGVCQECPNPVEGTIGRSLYCAACNKRRRRTRERKHRRGPEVRERRAARRRELHAERMATDPEYAEAYRRRKQRETSIRHPSYEKRIEYFRRLNADPERAERKRQLARDAYYREHPERPKPFCATCEGPIPYNGRGRPPKYHRTRGCNPFFQSRDQEAA
jgi:hypothetical protein